MSLIRRTVLIQVEPQWFTTVLRRRVENSGLSLWGYVIRRVAFRLQRWSVDMEAAELWQATNLCLLTCARKEAGESESLQAGIRMSMPDDEAPPLSLHDWFAYRQWILGHLIRVVMPVMLEDVYYLLMWRVMDQVGYTCLPGDFAEFVRWELADGQGMIGPAAEAPPVRISSPAMQREKYEYEQEQYSHAWDEATLERKYDTYCYVNDPTNFWDMDDLDFLKNNAERLKRIREALAMPETLAF